jgi:hypothetical protein
MDSDYAFGIFKLFLAIPLVQSQGTQLGKILKET